MNKLSTAASTAFLSDVHLHPDKQALTDLFLSCVDSLAGNVDALYILGDLFEYWVGDDHQSELNHQIIAHLKQFTHQGTPLYLMHGNRDFLLGKRFFRSTGCRSIKDPSVITLYGQSILLTHGDVLFAPNEAYIKFRKKIRHPICQKLFLWQSLNRRKKYANRLREISQHNMADSSLTTNLSAHNESAWLWMIKHSARYLVHGHMHQPEIHFLPPECPFRIRASLGTWNSKEGSILLCSPNPSDPTSLMMELRTWNHGSQK